MHGWKRAGRGGRARLVATLDRQEAAVLRGLVREVLRMLEVRTQEQPREHRVVRLGRRARGHPGELGQLVPRLRGGPGVQHAQDLPDESPQHGGLLPVQRRDEARTAPAPGALPPVHARQTLCMVAQRPAACSLATSPSIFSLSPDDTAALPLWCTSSISAVAFGSG